MIKATNLTIKTKNNYIIKNVNFEIKEGELISVLGNNGSGKTSLVKSLINLNEGRKITSGYWEIQGKKVNCDIIKDKIAFIPQVSQASPGLTVFEYVSLAFYASKPIFSRFSQNEKNKVNKALKRVGILNLKDSYLIHLSGGELQKTSLALGLVYERPILIFDEPTNHLDLKSKIEIYKIIKNLHKQGKTIILVTHELNSAAKISDRLIFLSKNKIAAIGKPNDVITKQNLQDIFNVEAQIKIQGKVKSVSIHD